MVTDVMGWLGAIVQAHVVDIVAAFSLLFVRLLVGQLLGLWKHHS